MTQSAARARAEIISACRGLRSEEHTSELQSQSNLVCRLLLEKKKTTHTPPASRGRRSLPQDDGGKPTPPPQGLGKLPPSVVLGPTAALRSAHLASMCDVQCLY